MGKRKNNNKKNKNKWTLFYYRVIYTVVIIIVGLCVIIYNIEIKHILRLFIRLIYSKIIII